jgi:hypothetical protein
VRNKNDVAQYLAMLCRRVRSKQLIEDAGLIAEISSHLDEAWNLIVTSASREAAQSQQLKSIEVIAERAVAVAAQQQALIERQEARESAQAGKIESLTTTLSRLEATIIEHETMHREQKAEIERLRAALTTAHKHLATDAGSCPVFDSTCPVCLAMSTLGEALGISVAPPDDDALEIPIGGADGI